MSYKLSEIINKKKEIKFKPNEEYERKKQKIKEKEKKEKEIKDYNAIEIYNLKRELSLFNDNINKHLNKYNNENNQESFELIKKLRKILFGINLEI